MIETIILSFPVLYIGYLIVNWIFPGPSSGWQWSSTVCDWLGVEQAWRIPPERKWLLKKTKFLTGLIELSVFIFRCFLALLVGLLVMICIGYIADFLGTEEEILRWEVDDNNLMYKW